MNDRTVSTHSSTASTVSARPKLVITPRVAGVSADGCRLDVLVRLQGADAPRGARHLPLRLALVLDRSGSMSGRPLAEAVRCAEHIVRHSSPGDRISLSVYDNRVQTLVPLTDAANPGPLLGALREIVSGGSTDLHGGWLAGAGTLASAADAPGLSRVLLLSDGLANQGLTDVDAIVAQCREMAAAGVSTTTIGLGGGFNEELMVRMATAGGGQSYYGQGVDDLKDGFDAELQLLQSICARRIRAEIASGPGVLARALSPKDASLDSPIVLRDLAHSAEAWMLLQLHISPKSLGSTAALLSAQISGETSDGTAFTLPPAVLELPVLAPAAFAALAENLTVAQRAQEVEAGNIYQSVRDALSRHDRPAAEAALASARDLASQNAWIEDSVIELERLMEQDEVMAAKEALYASQNFQTRLAAPAEPTYGGSETSAPASAMPAFLRRKGSQGRGK